MFSPDKSSIPSSSALTGILPKSARDPISPKRSPTPPNYHLSHPHSVVRRGKQWRRLTLLMQQLWARRSLAVSVFDCRTHLHDSPADCRQEIHLLLGF